jgi:carboxyl-terminal processing protease
MKIERALFPASFRNLCAIVVLLLASGALAPLSAQPPPQQKPLSDKDRDRGREILKIIREDLEENYYDPKFRGMDLDARFKAAKEKINAATSNGQIFGIIAQVLIDLHDSHTFFIPPDRVEGTDYGWEMQVIGETPYVVDVTPGSDAEAKGVRVGDEVWSIDGFQPTRENLWKIRYSYYTLKPHAGMRLVLQDAVGKQREVEVAAKLTKGRERFLSAGRRKLLEASRFHEVKNDLIIWKLPTFEVSPKEIDEAMKRVAPFKSLILDLRGNGGGYEETLLHLLGYFFEREVKLGEAQRRKGSKQIVVKTQGEGVYKGRLVVLIDSDSASASELFARAVQLEKRATIIGDRSMGAVMRAKLYGEADVIGGYGVIRFTPFAVSITDADFLMTDGKSLEGAGVAPDELLMPKGTDLAAGRDPILARAAAVLGVELKPEEAGAFFPILHVRLLDDKQVKEAVKGEKEKKEKNEKSVKH